MKCTYRKWPDGSLVNWRYHKKCNNKLAKILTYEIQKEINREVVRSIAKEIPSLKINTNRVGC